MTQYDIKRYDLDREEDIKAEARLAAFFAIRKAWKDRSSNFDLKAQDLAEALGKDKGYVSRVLSGKVRTITIETLAVFLHALGYHLSFDPVRIEDLQPANREARLLTSGLQQRISALRREQAAQIRAISILLAAHHGKLSALAVAEEPKQESRATLQSQPPSSQTQDDEQPSAIGLLKARHAA